MTTTYTLSPIEQIAQDVADNGDGWRFMWSPDFGGRRARLLRDQNDDKTVRIEIIIVRESRTALVFAGCEVRGRDGLWTPVSVSVRNPITRRALEEINRRLDGLEGMVG